MPFEPGHWTLPGGGLEFGDSPTQATVRVVEEENGLVAAQAGLVEVDSVTLDRPGASFHNLRVLHRANVIGGELRHEVEGSTDRCAWVSRDDLNEIPLVDLARLGAERAFRDLRRP